jgi:ABC-type dipeptide/oligopeptide/nickel transport system permease subunit
MWQRLQRHRLAQVGFTIVLVLLLVAIFAPLISPVDPQATRPNGVSTLGEPHPPGGGFLLGADSLGRDVWTRTLYGARISLLIGFSAMITAVLIGTAIGLLSGFFGGWVDAVLMRITEIVMALPTVLLAIALRVVLPDYSPTLPLLGALDPNLYKILVAIGLVTWTGIARAVRGQVFSLKEREFIEAARAVGCSNWRILTVHLLPNVAPTVIVLATLATAHNILLEAGLSFLGLGVDPSIPSWGTMIADGQPFFLSAPWILLAPGVAIVLAVAGFNFVGQAMQETLEPRR